MSIFTIASVIAALSHGTDMLIVARAIQGLGAAIVTPLTLTILAEDTPPEQRGAILGAWGGIAGLAVAVGPIVGGALTTGIAWQWIFWLNVPIGLVTVPLAWIHLRETKGPADKLDVPGVLVAVVGLFCIVWGVVRSNTLGWGSTEVLGFIVSGLIVIGVFVLIESRSKEPMLPLRFFKSRAFSAANGASVAMYFGMFGSIFLLTQYLQTVLGNSALGAGVRMLAWTGVTMLVAPAAGILSDRIGGRPLMVLGLVMQAVALGWMAAIVKPALPYSHLVIPFIIAGIGMGLFFAPVANVVLSAVGWQEQGQASGANNALRELGGCFGVAVLAAIFANQGGYGAPQHFIDGLKPAMWVGAMIVAIGAVIAMFVPGKQPVAEGAADWSGAAAEGGGDWSAGVAGDAHIADA